ncbi:tectonic [Anopheles aquasalis]|uniref:tectonic n=1 Tax=Anopheles aquasalis TaxID=42839 RepID=UPI00215A212B|nr:tectonic [Anopheles aquasalis]
MAILAKADSTRNVQSFVRIDVSKINQKNATETTTVGNGNATEGTTSEATTTTTSSGAATAASTTETTSTSSSSTTSIPSSTSPTPSTAVTMKPINLDPVLIPPDRRAAKIIPKGYYCRCDLKINICEINCCCDIDCNEAALKTFDCNQEQLDTGDYHHDEGLQSCRVQGGLLCLIEPIHEEGDELQYNQNRKQEAMKHRWKNVFRVDSKDPDDSRHAHYRVDDLLYFYNETSESVEPFTLPYSLTGNDCHIEQHVRFLRNRSNRCRRLLDDVTPFNRRFLAQQASNRFFRSPKKSMVTEHPCMVDGDCLNVTLTICRLTNVTKGWSCINSSNTTNSTTSDTLLGLMEESEDEYELQCSRIELQFRHNFTDLLAVDATLFCERDNSAADTDSGWQRITVRFEAQSSRNVSYAVSGNLGYLRQKPLIVTHFELPPTNTTNAVSGDGVPDIRPSEPTKQPARTMLAYFTNGTRLPDETFRLRLPISRRNRCHLSEQMHGTIDFGVDSWHRCNYVPSTQAINDTEGNGGRNYTSFCRELQEQLYSLLLPGILSDDRYDHVNLYVSKYGNPVNRTVDWIPLRTVNAMSETQLGGEDTVEHFTCRNMHINVDYRFYYAVERVHEVRHQAIIHDGEIVFGPRVNLRFRLDEEIRIPIFVQVQFFDLTSSAMDNGPSPWIGWFLFLLTSVLFLWGFQ